jgi:hypothetical protein
MLHRVVRWWMFTNVSEVLTASIIRAITHRLMMEAVSTTETSVNFYQTSRRDIPESHLHTCRRKNLKSHIHLKYFSEAAGQLLNCVVSYIHMKSEVWFHRLRKFTALKHLEIICSIRLSYERQWHRSYWRDRQD